MKTFLRNCAAQKGAPWRRQLVWQYCLALSLLSFAVGASSCDSATTALDGGTEDAACRGQTESCASLAGGACDSQSGCFSAGSAVSCNGAADACDSFDDEDNCLGQSGCDWIIQ